MSQPLVPDVPVVAGAGSADGSPAQQAAGRPGHRPRTTTPDPVAAAVVEGLGGPPGRYARTPVRFWTPVRLLVVLILLTSLVGFWQKAPCRYRPWTDEYQYTRLCYTDVFALYYAEGLDRGQVPYRDQPVEYPVVIGAAMLLASVGAQAFPPPDRPARFYDLTWVLLTAGAVVAVVTTARLAGRRPWDAALVALAPALVLHGTTNWDLVAVALAGLGLLQWARGHPVAAGAWFGLATAAKLYPVLFLVPLAALCLRAGRLPAFWRTAAGTLLVPVALTLPVYLTSPSFASVGGQQTQVAGSPLGRLGSEGLFALAPHVSTTVGGAPVTGVNAAYRFVELNTLRPADWDSLWYILQTARGGRAVDGPLVAGQAPRLLNALVAVLVVAGLAGVLWLALRAPRRPRLPQLLLLTVVAFLLPSKVWSPQYSLWLVPLVALALPRWRPFLTWQAAEAALLLTRFLFFVSNDVPGKGIGVSWFLSAVLVRDAVVVGIAALVVRDVLHPERDVVRADGSDDPAGGALDGAADRLAPAQAMLPVLERAQGRRPG